jgi:spermidine synthase
MRRTDFVFFLSGVAALVYESVWARLLSRVLGSHAQGTAVVLAVFMLGLGLGAVLLSRAAARSAHPQRLYAGLEAFIALWAAAVPFAIGGLQPVDGLFARIAIASTFLLPPTLAMGATVPLMTRLVVADRARVGQDAARFYGANTLGACVGALLAVTVFMPRLGLDGALWGAALLSLVVAGLGATLASPPRAPAPAAPEHGRTAAASRLRIGSGAACAFAFGAAGLALEVVMTRVLISVTGASVYAFALVLAVFLGGIALGSFQAREWLAAPARPLAIVERCAWGAVVAAALGVLALRWQLGEADLFGGLDNRVAPDASPLAMWASHGVVAALALFGPAVAFGAALPACAALEAEHAPQLESERVLGRVYLANTLGALLGAVAAGFVLLTHLGPRLAFVATLAPLALVVMASRFKLAGNSSAAVGLRLATLALVAWSVLPGDPPPGRTTLYSEAGRCENVAVEDNVEAGGARVRAIRINGKVEASTAPVDMRLQRLLAYIPGLLHGAVKSAAVVGLGAGTTAGALLDLPHIERIELFELEPKVADAARLFAAWNGGVVDDPRVTLHFVDGRHALMRATAHYDLITSDPVHIWTRGSSDLYTLEYFQALGARLAPGGVASQWLSLYELSTEDVQVMVATWCAAFEHVAAYLTAYDLALIGANEPWSGVLAEARLSDVLAAKLAEVGVLGAHELAALDVADDAELRAWCANAEPMRDSKPVLEFRAPLSFLAGYSVDVLRWAGRPEVVERLPAVAREHALVVRRDLKRFLDDLPKGRSAAAEAYGRALTDRASLGRPPADR